MTMIEAGEVFAQKSVDEFMESVQKWNGILPQKTTDDKLFATTVHEEFKIGNLSEFYTVGEREESERILKELGIEEYSGQQITLEEIYILLKKMHMQGKVSASGVWQEGGLKNE